MILVVVRNWSTNDLDELLVLDGAVDVDVGLAKYLVNCKEKKTGLLKLDMI